jgi:hypothetical protein
MKNIGWLVLAFISFFAPTDAQKVAVKFDEFSIDYRVNPSQEQRLKEFANKIKQLPGTRAVVIRYFPRVQMQERREDDFELLIIQRELEELSIPTGRIVTINGGIRDDDEEELWIVPRNTPLPRPMPAYDMAEIVTCPNSFVMSRYPYFILRRESVVQFGTEFYFGTPPNVSYTWTVSEGEIIAGNGTSQISLDVSRTHKSIIVVKVQAHGLPVECDSQASATMHIVEAEPFLFQHAVRYNYSSLSAIVQALFISIDETPKAKAYVIAYGDRREGQAGIERALASVRRSIAFLKIDPDRFVLLNGGYRYENSVDLWVVPEGSKAPPVPPTIR